LNLRQLQQQDMIMASTSLLKALSLCVCMTAVTPAMAAETLHLQATKIAEWKAVYGSIETRDQVPARARIGGTLVELKVTEGDTVKAGDVIATVKDDKIDFQIKAVDAQLLGLASSLENARTEVTRTETLIKSGVATVQRLDQLRTNVDVLQNQIVAAEAQRSLYIQQGNEGAVLAAASGKVLNVPVTRDSVILAGETVATIGGGGFFLRLAIPERHASQLVTGADIEIGGADGTPPGTGKLVKIYPEIDNGRVIADVEMSGIETSFVNARVLVRVPVGSRNALLVPQQAVKTRFGIDYVTVVAGEETADRTVVIGNNLKKDGKEMIEIMTGLAAGDEVVLK
jgi:RND family efflux transporter MFP subunit